jgi:hypothetical protein
MRRVDHHVQAALLMAALVVAPATITSQVPEGAPARVAALRPGSTLRLALGPRRVEGQFIAAGGDSILLRSVRVRAADVDTAWVRKRAVGRGAVIGGLVGGVVGAVFLRTLVVGLCDTGDGCKDDELPALGVGFAIGAGSGGLLGAAIGAFLPVWKRIHP